MKRGIERNAFAKKLAKRLRKRLDLAPTLTEIAASFRIGILSKVKGGGVAQVDDPIRFTPRVLKASARVSPTT